jgi:hypothetical protein
MDSIANSEQRFEQIGGLINFRAVLSSSPSKTSTGKAFNPLLVKLAE